MATPIRYFQAGSYYHVYNRGNRKQDIFLSKRDYVRFLERTQRYKNAFGITVICYCLMKNHFHFILRQDTQVPLSSFMLHLGTSYAKYFNIKYKQVGSLFQGPFKAKLIDTNEYLLHGTRYVHRNPLATPGVALEKYPWSSYKAYLCGVKDDLVDPTDVLVFFASSNPGYDYQQFVAFDVSAAFNPRG